ncbi:MAG: excinuclease ABC subunit UvrC [Syntrophobacteraceae bacterium]
MSSQEQDSTQTPAPDAIAEERPLFRKTVTFPHLPGVYLFRDEEGVVLYVGKAVDLRKRVGSYFRNTSAISVKTRVLVSRAADLEFVVTSTEKEALLLEASLIKKHRPRYNVILRDDKNYPALRIDPNAPYPRLEVVRRFQKDGALYFGPYPSGYAVRETMKLLNQVFPLRQCKGLRLASRDRPCLNYSLGRCLGACAGKISQEDYRKMVEEVILFLQGKTDVLQQQLRQLMEEAAEVLDFERAAFYRDRLKGIEAMLEKQHIVSDRFLNQDILGIHHEPEGTELAVLFVRQGVLIGQKNFDLHDAQGEIHELLASFIQQYYDGGRYIPDEILVPVELEDRQVLEEWLTESRGKRVHLWPVKRGERRRLLELAERNALERFTSRRRFHERDQNILAGLQRLLKLPRLPQRMACVDISNIQGQHAVGSVVVFSDGQPDKQFYRHFRIDGKNEPDDPAMMAEVVERLLDSDPALVDRLDLFVLDGGKGQLSRIRHLFEEKGMTERLPLISIAKEREADRGEKGRGLYEKIYIPGRKNPRFLSHYPDILHLLQRLRDEAHRFAITHYKSLHRQGLLLSALDQIPGIGPRRRQILLKHFGSIESLQNAGIREIGEVPGIPEGLAEKILDVLKMPDQE